MGTLNALVPAGILAYVAEYVNDEEGDTVTSPSVWGMETMMPMMRTSIVFGGGIVQSLRYQDMISHMKLTNTNGRLLRKGRGRRYKYGVV